MVRTWPKFVSFKWRDLFRFSPSIWIWGMWNSGLYDMTMLRFEPEQRVGYREYVRSDGTRSYFFCLDSVRDLFCGAGFTEVLFPIVLFCATTNLNFGSILTYLWTFFAAWTWILLCPVSESTKWEDYAKSMDSWEVPEASCLHRFDERTWACKQLH